MYRCFLNSFLLIFLSFAALFVEAQTLRVLSYNIHHGADVNGKLDLNQIASVIRASKPDLVALQEVDSMTKRTGKVDQLKELAALTGMYYFHGKSMDYDGGGYGVGILSKRPFNRSFVTRLPNFPKSEPRVAATIEIPLKKNKSILFTSIHLDYVADGTERLAQAQKLNEVFAVMSTPSIFAGDFNAPPEEACMKEVIFQDYQETDPTGKTLTFPSGEPNTKIDYVLVSKAHRWKLKRYTVIDERIASDHRPVLSIVQLN